MSAPLRALVRASSRLTGLQIESLGPAAALAVLCSVLAVCAALAVSVDDVRTYPGEDLRPKVLGARALLRGLDPYTYEAGPGTPEELQDYTRTYAKLTRVTYAPTLLALYAPLAPLPYGAQRVFWAVAEWAALLASLLLLLRTLRGPRARLLYFCAACVLFAASAFWRLHVERGQYYVFLLLLVSAALVLLLHERPREWPAGLLLGAAVALRPTLAVLVPMLFVLRLRRTALSACAAAAVAVLLTLPLAGIDGWLSYQGSVRLLERAMLGDPEANRALGKAARPPAVLEEPMISTLISINTKPSEQGMTSGLNAAYLSISNGIGPVIAALLVDQKTIVTAEKIARETGRAVSAHSYTSYSYPLYIAGVCTLAVLLLAVRSQRQYAPPVSEA